jgi:hypothetical protein
MKKMNVLPYPDACPYTRTFFKFWETFARKYHKTENTLVKFEDSLKEDPLIMGGSS